MANIFDRKKITEMTAEELLGTVQLDLWDIEPTARYRLTKMLYMRARSLGCDSAFIRKIQENFSTEIEFGIDRSMLSSTDVMPYLETDSRGNVKSNVDNFTTIIRKDPFFSPLRFNELSYMPVQLTDEKALSWTDADDARAKMHIENSYGIYNNSKYSEALSVVLSERTYNPVKEKIDSLRWDGKSRICEFLSEFLLSEDTPYTREVSRLIFAGGIPAFIIPGASSTICPFLSVFIRVRAKARQ